MSTQLWSLGKKDVVNSLIVAVISAVIIAFGGIVNQPGFNVFTADWGSILSTALNVSFITLISSLATTFASDKNGRFLGKV